MDDVTLEQALSLLQFPRELGIHEGELLISALGRFGPYLKCGTATVTLRDKDPGLINLEEAIVLLKEAKEQKKKAAEPLKTLGADPATNATMLVKVGRYGPYITDGKTNVSLPKKFTPETITSEEAADLLAKKRARGPSKWRKRG